MPRVLIVVDAIWLVLNVALILLALHDSALAFIFSLFFFGISYLISGVSHAGRGNPYKGMIMSPQPNEIEYSTYKMEFESRKMVNRYVKVNWLVIVLGVIPLIFSFYLLLSA